MTHTVSGFTTIFRAQLDASIPTHWSYKNADVDTDSILRVLNHVLRSIEQVDATNFRALQKLFSSCIKALVRGSAQPYLSTDSRRVSLSSSEVRIEPITEERTDRERRTPISSIMATRAIKAFAWAGPYSSVTQN